MRCGFNSPLYEQFSFIISKGYILPIICINII